MLGRDVVLRKTTFDECKGDRFEELLAGFASVVLRQQVRQGSKAIPCIQGGNESHRLPLIIAYRSSMRANLEERQTLSHAVLNHERETSDRWDRLLQTKKTVQSHTALGSHVRESAENYVRNAWAADPAWDAALIRGMPPGQSLVQTNNAEADSHGPDSMLRELHHLANEEEARLRRLQTFGSSLPKREAKCRDGQPSRPEGRRWLIFDKHRLLQPEMGTRHHDEDIGSIKMRHTELLVRLSNELAPDASCTRAGFLSGKEQAIPPAQNRQQEAVFELDPRLRPQTVAKAGSEQLPTAGFGHVPDESPDVPLVQPSTDEAQMNDHYDVIVSPPANEIRALESSWMIPHSAHSSPAEDLEDASTVRKIEQPVEPRQLSTPQATTQLSLQERTRISLAGALRDFEDMPSSPMPEPQKPPNPVEDLSTPHPTHVDHFEDLAQRTRKSMSLLTTIADMKTNRRKSKGPRVSQLYPVNPFETPRKTSMQVDVHTPGSNDSTPREKLFTDDADMSSVFKSRPKIALSPTLSPDRSMFEDDTILASRAGDLYLDDASDVDSLH